MSTTEKIPPLDSLTGTGAPYVSDRITAIDTQVGGSHYKDLKIQPWEVMSAWGPKDHFIGFLRFCILKRLGRWDSKDSALQDMKKARHEMDKLIEILEGE